MSSNPGGIVVKSVPKRNELKLWYNNGSYHLLTVGTTGSGKTQNIVMPSILSIATSGASIIINDPKGELHCQDHQESHDGYEKPGKILQQGPLRHPQRFHLLP